MKTYESIDKSCHPITTGHHSIFFSDARCYTEDFLQSDAILSTLEFSIDSLRVVSTAGYGRARKSNFFVQCEINEQLGAF